MIGSKQCEIIVASRVLILGRTGYLGAALAAGLAVKSEYHVVGSSRRVSQSDSSLYGANLLSFDETLKLISQVSPSHVFHCAGGTAVAPRAVSDYATMAANLLNACGTLSNKVRIISLGSAAEFVSTGTEELLNETCVGGGSSVYGVAKSLQWQVLLHLAGYIDNVDVVNGRIFNIIGPGMPTRFLPSTIAHQIASGQSVLELGNLSAVRGYVFIDDVVDALIRLAEGGAGGETYNICSSIGVSVGELVSAFVSVSGANVSVRSSARLARNDDVDVVVGSNAKIKAAVGWQPRASLLEAAQAVYLDARSQKS